MWVVGSERKLSRGSETETGEEEEDGFVGMKERGSSLSLLLDMILDGFEWKKTRKGKWVLSWKGEKVAVGFVGA